MILIVSVVLLGCVGDKKSENGIESVISRIADYIYKEEKRFYMLTSEVLTKFENGEIEEAKKIVAELNDLIPKYPNNWNYGNAIHKVNITSGRIALEENKIVEAKEFLIKAGKTKGSPQLNSFGPNMSLANELLKIGEKEVVIEYLDLCKVFWEMEKGKIESWKKTIKRGSTPQFSANLEY